MLRQAHMHNTCIIQFAFCKTLSTNSLWVYCKPTNWMTKSTLDMNCFANTYVSLHAQEDLKLQNASWTQVSNTCTCKHVPFHEGIWIISVLRDWHFVVSVCCDGVFSLCIIMLVYQWFTIYINNTWTVKLLHMAAQTTNKT